MNIELVTRRKTCRLCNHEKLQLVLPINASPIADAFVTKDKLSVSQPLIPLDLYQCEDCGHVQNVDIVNPDVLFRDYIFQTSNSAGLIKHFKEYAHDVTNELKIPTGSLVVELGSNDGTLLKNFKEQGMNVLGVDPAIHIAEQATLNGVTTLPDFFTTALAKKIKASHGSAKLIVANNVYAHADELGDMTNGICDLLDQDGVFVFEVSYLLDIVDNFLFDTIYHEHLSYHAIEPFQRFFKAHGLHLFNVEKVSSKGGSIRGFVQKLNAGRPEKPIVKQMIDEEQRRGLGKSDIFKVYAKAIDAKKEAVKNYVNDARKQNKKIACYGASTTVITLMYHFELENNIDYLIDDNPKKQGMYSPGKHLEVKSSSVLYGHDKPDIVLILAWQYATAICEKHIPFIENGGQMTIPLPELRYANEMIPL